MHTNLFSIINTKIHTITNGIIENGYIVISDGKIHKLGHMKDFINMSDDNFIDLKSYNIFPGFIDIHTHLGLIPEGKSENYDKNKKYDKFINLGFSVLSKIDINDMAFCDAVNAGITTVVVSPGSTELIAGTTAAVKTFGKNLKNRTIKENLSLKVALGENPIKSYKKHDGSTYTSEELKEILVNIFSKALKQISSFDFIDKTMPCNEMDILSAVLKKEMPVHFHAHSANDIETAIHISNIFNLDYAIIHATESHMILEKLKNSNCKIIQGPFFTNRSKQELLNMDMKSSALLSKNNLLFSLTTDHPELPIQFLPLCASFTNKNGLDPTEAIKNITINPAKLCHLDHIIGSIEKGKHADLVAFKDNPLNPFEEPILVIGQGKILKSKL